MEDVLRRESSFVGVDFFLFRLSETKAKKFSRSCSGISEFRKFRIIFHFSEREDADE